MTTQEKQIKVAEIVGWKYHPTPIGGVTVNNWEMPKGGYVADIPHYVTSIDAIRSAVLAQDAVFRNKFDEQLHRIKPYKFIPELDASDWCDAFLAAHHASKGKGG